MLLLDKLNELELNTFLLKYFFKGNGMNRYFDKYVKNFNDRCPITYIFYNSDDLLNIKICGYLEISYNSADIRYFYLNLGVFLSSDKNLKRKQVLFSLL